MTYSRKTGGGGGGGYAPGGTDVAVEDGGTGASTAATALANLGGLPLSVIDAADDLIVGSADNTAARLAVAASRIIGKKATGGIGALTAAEIAAILQDTMMPWEVAIDPYGTPVSHVNWNTWTNADVAQLNGRSMESTGAQNAERSYYVSLAAGTWTYEHLFTRSAARGICTVSLDGTDVGTIDFYGSTTYNILGSITGISVAAAGRKTMRLKMATKNASASSYYGDVLFSKWTRTA